MGSSPTGAGIAPKSLQAFHLLRAEQTARTVGAYADDWYPPVSYLRELDRAADAILRADATESGGSIRSYLGNHGIATRPRSEKLTDEDRIRLGPVDLMAEYAPRPAHPVGPDWGHRAGCTGCHRRAVAAYTSTSDPCPRWVDEDARISFVADLAARLRDELVERAPAPAPQLDRRPAVDLTALDALQRLVPDFELLVERAGGATYEAIGRRLGIHHELVRRRVGRAARVARAHLLGPSPAVCSEVDSDGGRDLDPRALTSPSPTEIGDRTAATGPDLTANRPTPRAPLEIAS